MKDLNSANLRVPHQLRTGESILQVEELHYQIIALSLRLDLYHLYCTFRTAELTFIAFTIEVLLIFILYNSRTIACLHQKVVYGIVSCLS